MAFFKAFVLILASLWLDIGCEASGAVAVKPGVCQVHPYGEIWCPVWGPALCQNDAECSGTEKCCEKGCGKRECDENLLPDVKKDGVCPDFDETDLFSHFGSVCDAYDCFEDAHCPGLEKCCTNMCGSNLCVLPK